MKTALQILNQVEPHGELLDTDKAIEAMEMYAKQFYSDIDEIIKEAHRQGWIFSDAEQIWRQDGYKSRTTSQLYHYIKKYKV